MPTEIRRVDTLTDEELVAANANPAMDDKSRKIILAELALRKRRREEANPLPVQRVTIVAVDIPFGDMISLMVKWSFAAVPAMIVVALIWLFVAAFLAALGAKR